MNSLRLSSLLNAEPSQVQALNRTMLGGRDVPQGGGASSLQHSGAKPFSGATPGPMDSLQTPLPSYLKYWGKARATADCGTQLHLLAYHGLDVAAVGRAYLQRHRRLLGWIAERIGLDSESALDWLTFWLALHDLGKFSVSFQNQRADLLWQLQSRTSSKAYVGVRHDSLGELLWRRHLLCEADVLGLKVNGSRFASRLAPWVSAVMGHHGQPPNAGSASLLAHFDRCDETAAAQFVGEIRRLFPPDAALAALGRACTWSCATNGRDRLAIRAVGAKPLSV